MAAGSQVVRHRLSLLLPNGARSQGEPDHIARFRYGRCRDPPYLVSPLWSSLSYPY